MKRMKKWIAALMAMAMAVAPPMAVSANEPVQADAPAAEDAATPDAPAAEENAMADALVAEENAMADALVAEEAATADAPQYQEAYQKTGESLGKLADEYGIQVASTGGEWMTIGLGRAGLLTESQKETYYQNVREYVTSKINDQEQLHRSKSTDNSRVILGLLCAGYDPTDLPNTDGTKHYNLLNGYTDMKYVQRQGINGPIWTLIALDSFGYEDPNSSVTREALIQAILALQQEDGQWTQSSTSNDDPDITGMTLQALAPYYQKGDNAQLNAAVDKALKVLSEKQCASGGYVSAPFFGGGENVESIAQVLVALIALGIDPVTDPRFVKEGNSTVDAVLSYYVEENGKCGFRHAMNLGYDGMATEQAYYALVAYDRFLKGQHFLYDLTPCKVFFHSTGGSEVAEQPMEIEEGGKLQKPEDPSREGFTFEGWYDGDVKWDFEAGTVDKDLNLTAHWKEIPDNQDPNPQDPNPQDPDPQDPDPQPTTYTVTFNSDGGTAVAAQTITAGGKVTKPADPTRAGYTFDGWYNGSAKWDFETGTVNEGLTLTAHWKQAPVTQPNADKPETNQPNTSEPNDNGQDAIDEAAAPEIGDIVTSGPSKYKVTATGKKNTVEYVAPKKKNAAKIKVPASVTIDGTKYKVTSIQAGAFKNSKKLKTVSIGPNVTAIGSNAFAGCKALTSVAFGKNVASIGAKAFRQCAKLSKVTISSKVKKIGQQAFCGCKSLESITVKSTKLTKKNVGSKAFSGINSKAKIKVPKKKLSAYKTLFQSKGIGKKVKVTKI